MNKIKDTGLGAWLKEKAPKALEVFGDLLPDQGTLGILKNIIDVDPDISPEQKAEFQKLKHEQEMNAQNNVTKRWESDMGSDVKIAKVWSTESTGCRFETGQFDIMDFVSAFGIKTPDASTMAKGDPKVTVIIDGHPVR